MSAHAINALATWMIEHPLAEEEQEENEPPASAVEASATEGALAGSREDEQSENAGRGQRSVHHHYKFEKSCRTHSLLWLLFLDDIVLFNFGRIECEKKVLK